MPTRIRVLCVDDYPTALDVLQLTLELEPDMVCVGSLTSADSLLSEVASKRPDIVLIDLTMPGKDPVEAIKEVSRVFPDCRVIAHSGAIDAVAVARLCEVGAWGCVAKGAARVDLLRTIREVARGHFCCLAA